MLDSFKEICARSIAEDLPVFYSKLRFNEKYCIAVYFPGGFGRGYYCYCAVEDWIAETLLKKFKDAGVRIKHGVPVYLGEKSGKPVYKKQ